MNYYGPNRFPKFSQGDNSANQNQNPYMGQNTYNYGQVQNPYLPPQPTRSQNQNFTSRESILQGLQGRILSRPDEAVAPGEVSMNGFPSIFPIADGSQIIVKYWDDKGNLQQLSYIPVPEDEPLSSAAPPTDDRWTQVMDRLDKIEKLVKKNAYRKPYSKKEGNDNAEQ